MEEQKIDQHILNYLEGKSTANEIETLRTWIKEDKANEVTFETISSYWQNSSLKVQYYQLDATYLKLQSLHSVESKTDFKYIPKAEQHHNFRWLKYAAALFLFISISAILYLSLDRNELSEKTELAESKVKQNPRGQKLTTFLPDGSKVVLNSESRIEYNSGFNGTERLVILDGEAFFEVKKDEGKPFRVETGSVSVVALGTSFNVNSKSDKEVEVSLVTGSVRVSMENDQSVVLEPGKSAIGKEDGNILVVDFDFDEKVGWKDGLLVFKDNSLVEIFEKLKDWYGVEILSEVPMGESQHFSGKYRNVPLDEVLEGIAFVHHFNFEITGESVRIYEKK